jgi:3-hydroxyacyl-[acyl-carrier-protein] dehydratase
VSPHTTAAALPAVDGVTVDGPEAFGTKAIRATDRYLAGHYPGAVIYPGVFIVESACQVVARWAAPVRYALAAVDSVRFTAALRPGDTLRLAVRCTERDGALHATVRGTDAAGQPVARMALRFNRVEEAGDGA